MAIDLEAIEARLEAATPGPWEERGNDVIAPDIADITGFADVEEFKEIMDCDPLPRVVVSLFAAMGGENPDADAALIAHAPTDIAALIAEVRRLRGELDKLQEGMTYEQYRKRYLPESYARDLAYKHERSEPDRRHFTIALEDDDGEQVGYCCVFCDWYVDWTEWANEQD